MRRFFEKCAAIMLALMMLLALVPAALAEGETVTPKKYDDEPTVTFFDAGSYTGYVRVQATIYNGTDKAYTLDKVTCISDTLGGGTADLTEKRSVAPETAETIMLTIPVNNKFTGSVQITLGFYFNNDDTDYFPATGTVDLKALTFSDNLEDTKTPAFRLSATDANDVLVPTPSGNAGQKIKVRIPLQVMVAAVANVSVKPQLSTDLAAFPFTIEQLDYTKEYAPVMKKGGMLEFIYEMTLSPNVTSGVKKVTFDVSFTRNWTDTLETQTIDVYVNVRKGASEGTDKPGETSPVSMPKVILDGYSFSTDKIYAGDVFDVTFTLRNTSSSEAVKNIQISISDDAEVGTLIPASGGSNSLFIDKIGKGETHTKTISMQSPADATPKAYMLSLKISYEGAENVVAYTATESIAVTVQQRIRLKFDEPQFYDAFYTGQSTGAFIAMYNLGKSTVYNCFVSIEGEGLKLEEEYYGGNITAGGSMRADINILPEVAGDIEGAIVITYEDSLNEQMQERIPISIYVEDMSEPAYDPMNDPYYEGGVEVIDEGKPQGFPVWAWIAIGVVVAGGVVVALVLLKKKRARELEDV